MSKKLLAIMFAALLTLGSAACTVDADDEGEGTNVEVEQTEVQEGGEAEGGEAEEGTS